MGIKLFAFSLVATHWPVPRGLRGVLQTRRPLQGRGRSSPSGQEARPLTSISAPPHLPPALTPCLPQEACETKPPLFPGAAFPKNNRFFHFGAFIGLDTLHAFSTQESCGLCSCSEEAQDAGGLTPLPHCLKATAARDPPASTQPCSPGPGKTPDPCSLWPSPSQPCPQCLVPPLPLSPRPPCSSLTLDTRVPSTCLPKGLLLIAFPATELCAHTEPHSLRT